MTSLDILYIILGLGILVISTALGFLVYEAILTLRIARSVLSDIKETTADIDSLKNGLKYTALSAAGKLLSIFRKGGE